MKKVLVSPDTGEMTNLGHIGIKTNTLYDVVIVAERNNSYIQKLIKAIGSDNANNVINFASEFKKGTRLYRND